MPENHLILFAFVQPPMTNANLHDFHQARVNRIVLDVVDNTKEFGAISRPVIE